MATKIELLMQLENDLEIKTPETIDAFQGTIVRIIKDVFGKNHEFTSQAENIKRGWVVSAKYDIFLDDPNLSLKMRIGKLTMFKELVLEAVHYLSAYAGLDHKDGEPVQQVVVHNIETQINGNIHNEGIFQTGKDSTVSIDLGNTDMKKWYEKGLAKWLLGVLAAIASGVLLYFLIEWIKTI